MNTTVIKKSVFESFNYIFCLDILTCAFWWTPVISLEDDFVITTAQQNGFRINF